MANVVLLGSDPAVLKSLAQSLADSGHRIFLANDTADILAIARAAGTTVLVTERSLLLAPEVAERLPARLGADALIAFHSGILRDDDCSPAIPQRLHRLVLADLCLPQEMMRLLALIGAVEHLAERADRGLVSGLVGAVVGG